MFFYLHGRLSLTPDLPDSLLPTLPASDLPASSALLVLPALLATIPLRGLGSSAVHPRSASLPVLPPLLASTPLPGLGSSPHPSSAPLHLRLVHLALNTSSHLPPHSKPILCASLCETLCGLLATRRFVTCAPCLLKFLFAAIKVITNALCRLVYALGSRTHSPLNRQCSGSSVSASEQQRAQ